eukprot:g53429.t1
MWSWLGYAEPAKAPASTRNSNNNSAALSDNMEAALAASRAGQHHVLTDFVAKYEGERLGFSSKDLGDYGASAVAKGLQAPHTSCQHTVHLAHINHLPYTFLPSALGTPEQYGAHLNECKYNINISLKECLRRNPRKTRPPIPYCRRFFHYCKQSESFCQCALHLMTLRYCDIVIRHSTEGNPDWGSVSGTVLVTARHSTTTPPERIRQAPAGNSKTTQDTVLVTARHNTRTLS